MHLRGGQQNLIKEAKNAGLITVVSCHNTVDIELSFAFGADYVTLSPIFATPDKGEPLGLDSFLSMIQTVDRQKVFALGGIDDESKVEQIAKTGVFGFASIRYFIN